MDPNYRKGNWTMEETMVLIEAKRMDHERRLKRVAGHGAMPAELRWKWVEDYCRKRGCFRSQNQCNDKWDNLSRDFKKVREYERRAAADGGGGGDESYWRIEKNGRKERSLPSNMLPQIYEALMAVVERKAPRLVGGGDGGGLGQLPPAFHAAQAAVPPQETPAEVPTSAFSLPLPTAVASSDSETSQEHSPAKRSRKSREGTSGRARGTSSTLKEVGTTISRSVSIIAKAMKSSEERGERRHREMVRLHERRLQIEESKAAINRQGINTLANAINNLTNSILHLPPNKNQHSSSK